MESGVAPVEVAISMKRYGVMETRTLEQLIADGESLTVEFKRRLEGDALVATVACMANGEGGSVLVGVEDDGGLVGTTGPDGGAPDAARMAAYIQNNTEPAQSVAISVAELEGKQIVRIDVPRADPGPVGTRSGRFTRRTLDARGEPGCVPMTAHEIVSMGMLTRGQDFAASRAMGAELEDLDPLEFDRFRRMCRETNDPYGELSDTDILKALGLVPQSGGISLGAVLLFGREESLRRWVPGAEVLVHDVRAGSAVQERIVAGLLKTAERVHEFLDARTDSVELYVGMHRISLPLISISTRREAVANALVHRDYSMLGPIRIQLSDDEFVVTSAGGFPRGVTIENILEESRARSPILAEAFRRAGLVERRGKGVNEMFESQLRAGRDAPSYRRTTSESVTVAVPLGSSDIDLVRFLVGFENDKQTTLTMGELRVIHSIRAAGSATPRELAEELALDPAVVRSTAGRLVERGVLEARGQGRSRQYHLTARFYDLAQDRSAYVRVKGADPLQQERMILDYVQAYGRITRSQAAEVCQVAPPQARTTLKRLVDQGRLKLVGERRAAHYVLPSPGTSAGSDG